MENKGLKITKKLTIRIFAVALLMNAFVITGAGIWICQSREHYVEQATIATKNLSIIIEKSVTAFLDKVDLTMLALRDEIAREYASGGIDSKNIHDIIKQYDERLPEGNGLRIVDQNGIIQYAVSNVVNAKANVGDRKHFIEARDNPNAGLVAEGPIKGRMSNKWLITLGRRVDSGQGQFLGEIHESIPISFFENLMSNLDIGAHGLITIRNMNLELVVGYFGARVEKSAPVGSSNTVVPQLRKIVSDGRDTDTYYSKTTGADRVPRAITYRKLPRAPFFILVGLAEEDYLAPWEHELIFVSLLVFAFFVLSMGSFIFVYLNWKNQLRQANNHAQAMSTAKETAETALLWTKAILSSAGQGIYGVNRDGTTAFVNPKASEMLGWSAEELLGRHQHEIFHHTKPDGTPYPADECPILLTMETGTSVHVSGEVFWSKNGLSFPVDYVSSPLIRGEHVIGAVFIFYDTTAQIQREEAQRQAQEGAELANNAKSRFLATMSHEIRTPVTSVMSVIELLNRTQLDVEQKGYIETLATSSQTLLSILNDILDISKIEAGKLSIEQVECAPVEIISGVIDLCRSAASAKGLTLSLSGLNQLPKIIIADPVRLKQIFYNLIGNAIKFTEHGAINVCINVNNSDNGTALFFIDIADTGIGIDEAQMLQLFKPFSQGDASMTRRFGGTGLGLSITKRLVDLMGGQISVTSKPGVGSCFNITLPVKVIMETKLITKPDPVTSQVVHNFRALNILLAEDNAINQKLVKSMLQKLGHTVSVVSNGKEAITAVVDNDFDVVLMDMQMPEMGGDEATSIIRKLPVPRSSIPIIALTADVMPEDRIRYRDAGVSDFVAKPIDWNALSLALSIATT